VGPTPSKHERKRQNALEEKNKTVALVWWYVVQALLSHEAWDGGGGLEVGRAVGPRLMSAGCGPGSRATCSSVLFGVLGAYPPARAPGGELVAGYRVFTK
jgi:hypothetical protein